MKKILILLLIIIVSSRLINAQGNIIAKKVMPSVVLIVMEDENGQMLGLGSGFFISKNIIATNFHVIEGGTRGYVKFINSQIKVNIEGVVGIDKTHDIVLLNVLSDAPYLTLGDFNSVETGENVYVVGNPKGLEGTFSQGIVSSIRDIDGDKLLQITAPISPGSSGGPVLNSKGEVIGVSVATYKDGQNLNFAVPVSYLNTLNNNKISSVSLSTVSSPVNSVFTKKIGGKITEGVIVENFSWRNDTEFDYNIRNLLREDIYDVYFYVIFYNVANRTVYHAELINYKEIIPAGLAKFYFGSCIYGLRYKTSLQEFRVIDYKIVE